jgi:hypothetical protein
VIQGRIEKIKGGDRVKWPGPDARPDEAWGIRTGGTIFSSFHHFITAD